MLAFIDIAYMCMLFTWGNFASRLLSKKIERQYIKGGRETSAILLIVVGDGWKDQYIYIYIFNMGSKLDSFLRKRCFLFCFVIVVVFYDTF